MSEFIFNITVQILAEMYCVIMAKCVDGAQTNSD